MAQKDVQKLQSSTGLKSMLELRCPKKKVVYRKPIDRIHEKLLPVRVASLPVRLG